METKMEGKRSNSRSIHLLQKIRVFTRSIVEDLSYGRSPVIYINRFCNYCTDASGNCCCSHDSAKGVEMITLQQECHARRFEQSVVDHAINGICILLQWNRHNLSVVSVSKGWVSAKNSPSISTLKLVMGWLRFSEADRLLNCINHPDTVHSIPVLVEEVKGALIRSRSLIKIMMMMMIIIFHRLLLYYFVIVNIDIISVADYILVLEKESG